MQNDIYNEMAEKWSSPIVARAEAKRFTGGGISPKTLANADSKGIGPEGRFFVGRRVCYPVASFIKWLRQNAKGQA